jgi:hypothetical protein
MSTPAQIAANQANSQLSTGPRSEDGKSTSSLNALKSGLTGRTVVLPNEDIAAYERHVKHFFAHYEPVGEEETVLVQRMADTRWRLDRCTRLEYNLYALGQVEFAALFPNESPEVRRGLIEAHTFRAYQKEFRNLNIQEARLDRSFARDYARLAELQDARIQLEQQEHERDLALRKAAAAYSTAIRENKPFDPAPFGFEFSTDEILDFLTSTQSRAA